MEKRLRLIAAVFFLWSFSNLALAADTEEKSAVKTVKFGMYITNLYDINFAKNQYTVEFWSWFLHNDKEYKPLERTEIINGKNFTQANNNTTTEGDTHWDSGVFKVNINQQWDVSLFPFDTQRLTIEMEDSLETSDTLHFVPDVEGSSIAANTIPDGWIMKDFTIEVKDHAYPTTFGDPTVEQGTNYNFHRIITTITLKRVGLRIFSTTFLGFFVATILIIIVFSINMSKKAHSVVPLQPRITLCVGALFSAVGGIYGLAAQLPYTTSFTLSDSIQITTFSGIALAIIGSVLSDVLSKLNLEDITANVTRAIFLIFVVSHFGINGYLLMSAAAT